MRTRLALGATGVAIALYGVWRLLDIGPAALLRLPLWLGGAIVGDDLVLIPITLTVGWLLTRWARSGAQGNDLAVARTALAYVGITSLIALPLLLRHGKGANSTVLSRNYLGDWLLLEALIVLSAALVIVVRRVTSRR